jgi:hypothetical protein
MQGSVMNKDISFKQAGTDVNKPKTSIVWNLVCNVFQAWENNFQKHDARNS